MRTWYDTEFVERGPGYGIELLSIGMVREDGAELYRVLGDVPAMVQYHAQNHEWLAPNVWAHLPTVTTFTQPTGLPMTRIDTEHPDVASREVVAREVHAFCTEGLDDEGEEAQLWAYYGAYDHVCLAQLFGKMVDLPGGMPMFTCDIRQEMERLGITRDELPEQQGGEHDALADARWTKAAHEWIRSEA